MYALGTYKVVYIVIVCDDHIILSAHLLVIACDSHTAKETSSYGKRDLFIRQKRPIIIMTRETYH